MHCCLSLSRRRLLAAVLALSATAAGAQSFTTTVADSVGGKATPGQNVTFTVTATSVSNASGSIVLTPQGSVLTSAQIAATTNAEKNYVIANQTVSGGRLSISTGNTTTGNKFTFTPTATAPTAAGSSFGYSVATSYSAVPLTDILVVGTTAPTFTVTTLNDDTYATPLNCVTGSTAACTLRDAVGAANSYTPGGATIVLPASLATGVFMPSIILTNGSLTLANSVTITGPGADVLPVSGNYNPAFNTAGTNIFNINTGATVNISGLTLTQGNAGSSNNGGLILSNGNLSLTDMALTASTAANGGAIEADSGALTMIRVTVSGNTASLSGGALDLSIPASLTDCTLSGNSAAGPGFPPSGGGAIYTGSPLTLLNTTVTANSGYGGGLFINDVLTLKNSIVAGNSGPQYPDIETMNNGSIAATASFYGSSQTATTAPLLATLANYGGHTQTQPPLPGSPALCLGLLSADNIATDQRGAAHSNAYCNASQLDAGAVQTSYALAFTTQPGASVANDPVAGPPAVTLTENSLPVTTPQTLPLALNGTGTLANASAATSASTGVASYSSASVSSAGTGDTLTSTLTLLPSVTVAATSTAFNVAPQAPGTASSAVASPATGVSDAGGVSTVTVTFLDQNGDPIANATAAGTSTGSGVLSPASTTTNSSGQAIFTLTDTIAETVTLHFTLAGNAITAAPTVAFTAPPVYTVNSTADSAAATTCTATACRLRDAVAGANAYPGGGASIAFAPALTGTRANPTVITLSGTQLELTAGVTIAGPGADLLQINGGWNGSTSSTSGSGIFQVDAGTTVAISGLTLTRGDGAAAGVGGGAISSQGNLSLTDTAITASYGGNGGAIYANNGSLTLTRVTLSGNQAGGNGGAITTLCPTRIVNSTLTGNSTFSQHTNSLGGAIITSETVTLIGTTVTGNTALYAGNGGGIFGRAVLLNSIVAGNTASELADLNTNPTDLGGNLSSAGNSGTSTITPRLAPLGFYDGNGVTAHTMTMPPLPGSPAICAGVAQGSDTTAIPTTDQRGYPSLTGYSGTGCFDAGATTTSYAAAFTAPASAVSGDSFTSVLTVTEHGNTLAFPAAQATSTPALTSSPDTLPGYTANSSTVNGTYPFLATINGTATPDTLTATLPLTATAAGFSTTGTTRTIPSISLVQTASITVAQPVATTFTATATPSTGVSTSGGVSTVTVKVLDQDGDPIANQTVAVSTTGSAVLSAASVTTNNSGTATVNLSDTTAETVTVTATDSGLSATANVTFTAPPVFTVTSSADSTTIAACPAGNSASTTCTLRNAIAGANAYAGGGALVNILFTTPTTITLTAGQLELSRSATITGPGANLLTVSGNAASRVLQIDTGVTANISGLTLTRGATDYGAGISNNGTLFLTNAAITASNATTSGGAIYSSGPSLVLAGVTLSGNNASTTGGAVATGGGIITVINSTITGNTAPGYSGQGFQNAGNGGGFFLEAGSTLHLQSTTVTNNSATDAGGIAFGSATVTLQNSIVEGNSAQGGADFYIQPTDNGGNLFGVGNTPTNPALAPLGYYGGPTQTMPPLPGSPALCAGTLANLTAASANATDQRGVTHSAAYCTAAQVDAGAVQTRYSGVAFSTQPTNTAINTAISPSPAIVLTENTFAIPGASIPVALSTTGDYAPSGQPTLSGTLTATTTPATFSNLKLNQLAGGLHLTTTVPITSTYSLTAASSAFDVTNNNGAGTLYSTITDNVSSRPYPGDAVTLVATVTNLGGQTYLPTFTVTLPAGLGNISVASSTGNDNCLQTGLTTVTCIPGGTALTFYTGNVISVTIQATVTATDAVGSTIAVTAHATDLNNDPGNTATDTLTVSGIMVNTLADDATGTAANCIGAGACTLRDAVATVNAATGTNAIPIVFAASLSGTQSNPNIITLTNGQLELSHAATITGPGADLLLISGYGSRILQVDSSSSAAVSGLTFQGGQSNGAQGGAILSSGPLSVSDAAFVANSTRSMGGAIYANGTLSLLRTFFMGNAGSSGGAVLADGAASIVNSTFINNQAIYEGGAVYLAAAGNTLSNNTLSNNTITDAEAGASGGGLYFASSANGGTLTNNVIAGNMAVTYADIRAVGTFTDNGGNILNTSAAGTSTYTAAQLNFATFGYYGGHILTLPALPGSVALCAGVNTTANGYTLPATDARSSGYARTSSYSGTTCIDSSAFQAHYSLGLLTAATARLGEPITPNPSVNLLESGNFLSATATTNPVTLNGNPAISGQITQSAYTAGAWSFNPVLFLATDPAGNGTLTANLPLTATSTATSASIAATAILMLGTDGAPSASASTAIASPATLGVGGTSTVTVTVVDGTTGQPIEGASINVSTGPTSAVITIPSFITNNAGQATFTVTDATAEAVTLTVVVNGVTLNQHPTITFTAAPVFTVTNTTDTTTGVAANCPAGNTTGSACSLRDAVTAANATNGSTFIQFAPGIAGTQANPATITLNGTQLELANTNGTQTITGPGANLLQISGNNNSRVLQIDANVIANVSALTFTKGNGIGTAHYDDGGAIENAGTLNLSASTISNSNAPTGGGLSNDSGQATLSGVSILNNSAFGSGGGVFSVAPLTVIDSILYGNSANFRGGSGGAGGGIYFDDRGGSFLLTNTTITGNSGNSGGQSSAGGGVYTLSSPTTYTNSIIAGNSASTDPDTYGSYTDNGGNLATGGVGGQSTYTATTLLLAPLGYYGGTTQTMPPLPGSPALCAGVATGANGTANPTTDQRGKTHSAAYCSATQLDSGSVQTSYALAFSTQPQITSVGSAIAGYPSVLLTESASPFLSPANISIALNGPGSLTTYNSTTTVATSATTGIATFNNLFNDTPGKADTLTATIPVGSGALGVTSNAYEAFGPAVQLTFTTPPPATLAEGGNPGTLTVTQYDSAGNRSYYTSAGTYEQVTLTVTRNGQTVGTFTSMIGASDSASFNLSSLSLTASGTYTFTASATGLTSAVATETVTAGATTQLAVTGFPNPDAVSAPGTVTVTAQDSAGNTMTGFTGTVTLTSTDAAATLPGSYTFTAADKGVHTFNVTLNTPGTQAITATTGSGPATIASSEAAILVTGSTWIVNANGSVSRLNGAGTVLATTGNSGAAATLGGIAIDNAGDAWAVTNRTNSVTKALPNGTLAGSYSVAGINMPAAVAIDGLGMVWIANGNNSVSVLSPSGTAISPATGYQSTTFSLPSAIAIDQTGSVWITNAGSVTVTRIFGAAAPVVTPLVTGTANATQGARP